MIGRGCLGRPWLFADLGAVYAGRPAAPPPAFGVVAAVMVRHAELLTEDEGEFSGLCSFRRHAAWYTQGYPIGADARRALGTVASLAELAAVLDRIDPELPLPSEAVRWRRGHTDGPRPVRLPDGWHRDRGRAALRFAGVRHLDRPPRAKRAGVSGVPDHPGKTGPESG